MFLHYPAQSDDLEDVGTLTFMSISDGDVACGEIVTRNDTVIEGTETLTVTLLENALILIIVDTVQVSILDEGKSTMVHGGPYG